MKRFLCIALFAITCQTVNAQIKDYFIPESKFFDNIFVYSSKIWKNKEGTFKDEKHVSYFIDNSGKYKKYINEICYNDNSPNMIINKHEFYSIIGNYVTLVYVYNEGLGESREEVVVLKYPPSQWIHEGDDVTTTYQSSFTKLSTEYGSYDKCIVVTVTAIQKERENVHFTLNCNFVNELKIDQSLSHNGVCLTVVDKTESTYTVTAIMETLLKTNLGLLNVGDKVNLERSMMINGRLDGHIVQGHVDQTAICSKVEESDGSWYFTFSYDFDIDKARQGYMTVEKGSVTVNGVSLTVVNSKDDSFQVAIIPYTYEHTNFHTFKVGTKINLEFDIIGKYLSRLASYK